VSAAAAADVLRATIATSPQALWTALTQGETAGDVLGLRLRPQMLTTGTRFATCRSDGARASVHVLHAAFPSLVLRVDDGEVWQFTVNVEAGAHGSRITVLKEPRRALAAAAHADGMAAALAAELPAELRGTSIDSHAALRTACVYLEATRTAVVDLLAALPSHEGYRRPAGGGFALAEHVWHLADLEQFGWAVRAARIRDEARPRLPGVDGDRLAQERRYIERPWRGAARRFIAWRRRTLSVLNGFDEAALARPVVFAGRRAAAGDVLAAMVAHDHEHRTEMATLWNEQAKDRR
jgi:hypothetical protein